ncbi:hypothetical protein DFJ77DRAFT_440554 [Powellomyces hirtus]|nr:hypothetical protein DFJ77DRAFT_440554 [Powellomyces hirtus]
MALGRLVLEYHTIPLEDRTEGWTTLAMDAAARNDVSGYCGVPPRKPVQKGAPPPHWMVSPSTETSTLCVLPPQEALSKAVYRVPWTTRQERDIWISVHRHGTTNATDSDNLHIVRFVHTNRTDGCRILNVARWPVEAMDRAASAAPLGNPACCTPQSPPTLGGFSQKIVPSVGTFYAMQYAAHTGNPRNDPVSPRAPPKRDAQRPPWTEQL